MRILAVDDELVSRRLLKMTLESLGHQVTCCENGIEAWEVFEKNPTQYQVIISDWLMPHLDGLGFCEKVRTLELSQYTYFILLTANSRNESSYIEATHAGIDDFLPKPLKECQILACLNVAKRIFGFMDKIKEFERLLPTAKAVG